MAASLLSRQHGQDKTDRQANRQTFVEERTRHHRNIIRIQMKRKQWYNLIQHDYVFPLRGASIWIWRYRVTVPLVQIEFDLVLGGWGGEADGGVETETTHISTIWSLKSVWKRCPPDPLLFTNLLSNWKVIFSKFPLCAVLGENKCSKIDLRPQKRSSCVGIYIRDHFNLLWCQFTNMHNTNRAHEFHLSRPPRQMAASPPVHRGAQRGSGSVLTLYRKALWGMSGGKSAASWRIY